MGMEKSQIITLLEQGKLSVDDAERLLKAVGANSWAPTYDRQRVHENIGKVAGKAGDVAKTVRDKLGETWDSVEPKMRSGMRSALEKTIEVVDKLSATLKDSLDNMDVDDYRCGCGCEDEDCATAEEPAPEAPVAPAPEAPEPPADEPREN